MFKSDYFYLMLENVIYICTSEYRFEFNFVPENLLRLSSLLGTNQTFCWDKLIYILGNKLVNPRMNRRNYP